MIDKMSKDTEFIIFLDIDGVLHKNVKDWRETLNDAKELSEKEGKEFNILYVRRIQIKDFSEEALTNFKNLILLLQMRYKKISIVIISSWREGLSREDFQNYIFKDYFFKKLIIGKIKDTEDDEKDRGKNIKNWLREYKSDYKIKFAIIDDDNEISIKKYFTKEFVKIDKNKLFSKEDIDKILKL